ncbi:FAD-containing monooxygenase [Venturia nashicola]|nr:FAD-containing monooxygenase [Venturia nashicola]
MNAIQRMAMECEETMSGLQVFLDHIPALESEIHECIEDFLEISSEFRELEIEISSLQAADPDYQRHYKRLLEDIRLNMRSLQYTIRNVRGMFRETRHEKYSGARPYRRAWEDLEDLFKVKQRGPSLHARLETINIFLQNVLAALRNEPVDPEDIRDDRRRVLELLKKQESMIEQSFADMSVQDSPTGWIPKHPLRTDYPPSRSTVSDESDGRPRPPAPEPPSTNHWTPLSPTLSNSSDQTFSSARTFTSTSSAGRAQISHWGTKVFDGRHGSTQFRTPGEATVCFGKAEFPGIIDRLAAESFLEVVRLPLDTTRFYAKLYWRPSDHRARILLSTTDTSKILIHYCIPLTALKLTRKGSNLLLWRVDRDTKEFELWANLGFHVYEQLILFYCAFTAMKKQDWKKFPEELCDKFHCARRSEEKEEFSGEIKDDNYLHALRIYVDKDSGGIRLEARARRGAFTETPIWTAFIHGKIDRAAFVKPLNSKVIQLDNLHPYVLCHNYAPPRGKTGKLRLQFSSPEDATTFFDIINSLAR